VGPSRPPRPLSRRPPGSPPCTFDSACSAPNLPSTGRRMGRVRAISTDRWTGANLRRSRTAQHGFRVVVDVRRAVDHDIGGAPRAGRPRGTGPREVPIVPEFRRGAGSAVPREAAGFARSRCPTGTLPSGSTGSGRAPDDEYVGPGRHADGARPPCSSHAGGESGSAMRPGAQAPARRSGARSIRRTGGVRRCGRSTRRRFRPETAEHVGDLLDAPRTEVALTVRQLHPTSVAHAFGRRGVRQGTAGFTVAQVLSTVKRFGLSHQFGPPAVASQTSPLIWRR
jgi:hypothetical protein